MKVASITALSPTVTPWKDGRILTTSWWSARDFVSDLDGAKIRIVSHYSTEMVEFVDTEWDSEWHIYPLSVGRDSMSDKAGTAKLCATVDAPIRLRKGLWMSDKAGTAKLCETVEAPIRLRKGLWINIHNDRAIMHRDCHMDGTSGLIRAHNEIVDARN